MNKNILLHAVAAIAAIACVFSSCTRQGNISVAASDPDILYMGRIHWSESLTADFNYPGVTAMLNFNGTGLAMTAKPGSGQFMVEIDHGDAFKINFTDSVSTLTLSKVMRSSRQYADLKFSDLTQSFSRRHNALILKLSLSATQLPAATALRPTADRYISATTMKITPCPMLISQQGRLTPISMSLLNPASGFTAAMVALAKAHPATECPTYTTAHYSILPITNGIIILSDPISYV